MRMFLVKIGLYLIDLPATSAALCQTPFSPNSNHLPLLPIIRSLGYGCAPALLLVHARIDITLSLLLDEWPSSLRLVLMHSKNFLAREFESLGHRAGLNMQGCKPVDKS